MPQEPTSDSTALGDSSIGQVNNVSQAPIDDKPYDDKPFDAGVEADEETDPKKYIEQLTGKLGQSLRKYTETQGQPDFDLEKFAVNSVLSATHTSQMDDQDRKDIIKKVEDAGAKDAVKEPTEGGVDDEQPQEEDSIEDGEDLNFGNEGSVDENSFMLGNKKKSSIFAESIKIKLMELAQQSDKTITKPTTKPQTEKPIKRRDMPFLPNVEPGIKTKPKAMLENDTKYQIYHRTFSSAVQTAREYAEQMGYTIDDNEWFNSISTGNKKPSDGKTNKYSLSLFKDGIQQKKHLHIQVYGMSDKYELNCYIL